MKSNCIRKRKGSFPAVLGTLLLLVLYGTTVGVSGVTADGSFGAKVDRVAPKFVCMVNDQTYDKEQIAVVVEGKTYYGCCEMCKKLLQGNAEVRTAVDPVSGNRVDKAAAVIGVMPDGTVRYFENQANLQGFKPETGVGR